MLYEENIKPFADYINDWNKNANRDPFWAVLTADQGKNQQWNKQEFYKTGEEEIRRVYQQCRKIGISVPCGKFLDFGCGTGRLSRALIQYHDAGLGLDIADNMIQICKQNVPNVEFRVNQQDNLSAVESGSIDFLYSHIVLQHMNTQLQQKYLQEFLRVVKPGGIAVFQLPIARHSPKSKKWNRRLNYFLLNTIPFLKRGVGKVNQLRKGRREFTIEMHHTKREKVLEIVKAARGQLLGEFATNSLDTEHQGKLRFFEPHAYKQQIEAEETETLISHMFFVRV